MLRVFRPAGTALLLFVLAASAVALYIWPGEGDIKAAPLPVQPADREIAWLAPATSTANWERFLTAVNNVVRAMQAESLPIEEEDRQAFPNETTTVPEIAVSFPARKGKLLFRWYKLTSDLVAEDWVGALLRRNPPPLAVIGGNASDQAIELAKSLRDRTAGISPDAATPLLLLTQATVDDVTPSGPSLLSLYAGKTLRFCFTDSQIARMVTDFLWSQTEFRPDAAPIYLTYWDDDPYSKDLNRCFCDAVPGSPVQMAANAWAWQAGVAAGASTPLDPSAVWWSQFRSTAPESCPIFYSVGTFAEPNRWEEDAAWRLLESKMQQHPDQLRPLLVVPAATQPTRRFLRALARTAPQEARRFVIATGDSITFNALYRDRNMAWPIQDLPFRLVVFAHRNPVDGQAGFPPEPNPGEHSSEDQGQDSAGTEDLLLYMDLINALLRGCVLENANVPSDFLPASAAELRERLAKARWCGDGVGVRFQQSGPDFFDVDGNRRSGTGEHIVALHPQFDGAAILPEALLEVWTRSAETSARPPGWRRVRSLVVNYQEYRRPE